MSQICLPVRPLLSTLLLLTGLSLGAQTPSYLHYDVRDGLPSALVYCMEQDHEGFLWFGTDKGLARFDGTRFKNYGTKEGLPDPEVITLMADRRQRLWIYSFRKKALFRQGGRFVTEAQDSLLAKADLRGSNLTYFEDRDSNIWIGGEVQDFCRYGKDGLRVFKGTWAIRGVFDIGEERFAMGTTQIFRIHEDDSLELLFSLSKEQQRAQWSFSYAVHGNRVLLSYSNQAHLLEYEGRAFRQLDMMLGAGGTASVDRGGNFWACSPTLAKALRFNSRQNLDDYEVFLPGKRVSHMMEDRDGTLWFSTFNEGVYALPKNAVLTWSRLSDPVFQSDNILSIASLSDGSLLVGDDAGNLYMRHAGQWLRYSLDPSGSYNRVRQIIVQENGQWLAATDRGVFTPGGALGNPGQRNLFGAPKAIHQRGDKTWVGTSHALYSWQAGRKVMESDSVTRVTAIGADAEGNIWLGGLNNLLSERDDFRTRWGERFPALATRIIAIQSGGEGLLWVATPGDGLLRLSVKAGEVTGVEVMNEHLPQPIANVQALFVEPNGTVWLSTNTGVYAIDKKLSIRHFNEKSGLADNEVNATLVRGDTLWVATAKGLSQVLLRQGQASGEFSSRFSALRYQMEGRTIALDLVDSLPSPQRSVTLPAGAALLELDLTGLCYRSQGNLLFELSSREVRLPLSHLTWGSLFSWLRQFFSPMAEVVVIDRPQRNYGVHLKPGAFELQLTAFTKNGGRSLHPDHLRLTILPPLTKTIWASLLLWSLLGFAGWRLFQAGKAFRRLKNTASELQLQAIKAQINPHFIGNSINAIQQFFYPPDPLKASEYISIFTDLLRRTMLLSERSFASFGEELHYVEDYLKMIHLRFGERFQFRISGVENIPLETPFPTMLLQPILENSTIHGLAPKGVSKLEIDFRLAPNGLLTCTVTDNGVGISASKERKRAHPLMRVSKGISLLEQKIKMLNALEPIGLRLEIKDLSEAGGGAQGTRAVLSFSPRRRS